MSGAEVRLYSDSVLKIQPFSIETDVEYRMLQFLSNYNLAPNVLAHEVADGVDFLLSKRLFGKMLCDSELLTNPQKVAQIATDTLRAMWSIDVSTCHVNNTLSNKLKLAEYRVVHNLVDMENCQPDTYGVGGRFRNPKELLKWLYDNQPKEDLVVTHGDFGLPNIFWDGREAKVIDVGRGGVADRYQDIAILFRSLKDNINGTYGTYYGTLDVNMFVSALGFIPDWDKIDYYILLDELF